jgi:hypothetical protein
VEDPTDTPERAGEGWRLLIVAGATAASADELPPAVRALIEGASEVLVVSPILTSVLHLWTNDTDRAREQADERLATVLGNVEEISDADARGVVGDEVPLTAFDDAVRVYRPDHILIGLRSGASADWQEPHLVEKVRARFELPVTVVEIDERGRARTAGEQTSGGPGA